jgi:long-chain acyl-CoA synthetase
MLYERFRKTASDRRNELALSDIESDRRWTFGELLAVSETHSCPEDIVFPQGHSPEFIFTLLSAWRFGKMACPIETGPAPVADFSSIKKSCSNGVHLKTTSATTGPARFILFTAEQLIADVDNIMATMGLRSDWPNLGVISMAHSYGFSNLVLPLLLHGIPLILVPVPLPEMIKRAVKNEKTVAIAGVPAMWRAWNEADALSSKIRLAISAGAPLPLETERAIFQENGLKIHNFYGSSECGGIAYDSSEEPRVDSACVGALMKNVKLSLAPNGCLVAQSRAVGEAYWPEKVESLSNGIFQTADLAEIKEGLIYLRGRLSDQINVAGRKVSPEAIESILRTHSQVQDCVVFGAPSSDLERAETIVAIVVSRVSEMELKQFLLQTLPAWQIPRAWRFVDSLPTTARGKISRAQWRRDWSKIS